MGKNRAALKLVFDEKLTFLHALVPVMIENHIIVVTQSQRLYKISAGLVHWVHGVTFNDKSYIIRKRRYVTPRSYQLML